MSDPMQEIRDSFFVECEELLEALQDALAQMEAGDDDSETINVAFRAVHSIKGGAGAFGLDQLVAFTHSFETVMDAVRSDQLTADGEVVALFYQCADMVSDLVRSARADETLPEETLAPLLLQLDALSDGDASADEEVDFTPATIALDLPGLPDLPDLSGAEDGAPEPSPEPETEAPGDTDAGLAEEPEADGPRHLRIRFVPEPELYRSGNEPLFLLRALAGLGEMRATCHPADPPDLERMTAETSILAWDIDLTTDVADDAVKEVFDFVDGLCTLEISTIGTPDGPPPDGPEDPTDDGSDDHDGNDGNVEPADAGNASEAQDAGTEAAPAAAEADTPVAAETAAPDAGPGADVAENSDRPPEPPGKADEKSVSPAATAPAARTDAPSSAPARSGSTPGATVRVDLDRIDRLVNLVGELVINQAMLTQSVAASGLSANTKIATGLDEFQQLTRDIQDGVMMIRAQPVKSLFQRMGRIVRESSAAVGKTVRLVTEGEATEIDKTVIERLSDPLTHMIRNAVDHGLETPDARRDAGKSEVGNVTLTAAHRSGRVVIEVADDGSGIDRPRVKAKAEEKELIPPGQELSDGEIDNLLFLPGFSTAGSVSNLSGRGVGMDVVKNAISALGGRVTISSTEGTGTTFSISLPLTLAVLDGMVVRVAGETLVMPISAVSETLSLGPEDARTLGPRSHVVRVRDQFVPLVDLATELGYGEPRESYEGAIVLLVAQEDGSRAALIVDGIEDQRQVVIKGLEESYGRVPGVAAATILGDGQIALILDPADLLSNATGLSRPPLALTGTG